MSTRCTLKDWDHVGRHKKCAWWFLLMQASDLVQSLQNKESPRSRVMHFQKYMDSRLSHPCVPLPRVVTTKMDLYGLYAVALRCFLFPLELWSPKHKDPRLAWKNSPGLKEIPDLNSIELLWDKLECGLHPRPPRPTSVPDLANALVAKNPNSRTPKSNGKPLDSRGGLNLFKKHVIGQVSRYFWPCSLSGALNRYHLSLCDGTGSKASIMEHYGDLGVQL